MNAKMPLANAAYIDQLLTEKKLECVNPSQEMVDHLLAQAAEALGTAQRESEVAPTSAYRAVEDAVRLALTAFLQAQGLRPTSSAGHHHTAIDAVAQQLTGRAFPTFNGLLRNAQAIRVKRNQLSYPDAVVSVDASEARAAVAVAEKLVTMVKNASAKQAIPIFKS